MQSQDRTSQNDQGTYSTTTLMNILCLIPKICTFGCNTTYGLANQKLCYIQMVPDIDQRVENAGVAFAKGSKGRNEFFEKINKQ